MDEYKLDASSLSTFAPHLPRPPSHQGIIPIGSHYNMTRHVLMMEIGAVAGSVFFFFIYSHLAKQFGKNIYHYVMLLHWPVENKCYLSAKIDV